MSQITFKEAPVAVGGTFIGHGGLLMNFQLVNENLETVSLEKFKGKKKVVATVPSVDTPVCSQETIDINRLAKKYPDVQFIVISKDLPFAQKRFCKHEQINNIVLLSDMLPESTFAKDYGIKIETGPLKGLLARAVFAVDKHDKVIYAQLVKEITSPPDFARLESAIMDLI